MVRSTTVPKVIGKTVRKKPIVDPTEVRTTRLSLSFRELPSLSSVAAQPAPMPAQRTTRGKSAPKPTIRTARERPASPHRSNRQARDEPSQLRPRKRKHSTPLPVGTTHQVTDLVLQSNARKRKASPPEHHKIKLETSSPYRDGSSSEQLSKEDLD
jgi:hypothetical protein